MEVSTSEVYIDEINRMISHNLHNVPSAFDFHYWYKQVVSLMLRSDICYNKEDDYLPIKSRKVNVLMCTCSKEDRNFFCDRLCSTYRHKILYINTTPSEEYLNRIKETWKGDTIIVNLDEWSKEVTPLAARLENEFSTTEHIWILNPGNGMINIKRYMIPRWNFWRTTDQDSIMVMIPPS